MSNDPELPIEHGIPVPCRNMVKYPFRFMRPGDSFFVPVNVAKMQTPTQKRVTNSARRFRLRSADKPTFTIRSVEGGVRCWRLT